MILDSRVSTLVLRFENEYPAIFIITPVVSKDGELKTWTLNTDVFFDDL